MQVLLNCSKFMQRGGENVSLRELVFDIGFKANAAMLGKMNTAVDSLKSDTISATSAVDGLGKAAQNNSRKFDKLKTAGTNAMNGIKKYISNVNTSSRELSDNLSAVSTELGKLSGKATKLGTALTLGITTPMMITGKRFMSSAMDFESGMDEVAAISGASAKDMQLLTESARKMGRETVFSAKDSAAALKYMAMAGWDTNKMLGGLPGIMDLAAASGEDLGTVSDIVTDAMTAFGLSADKSTHFADVLAKASSKSNTNVGLMGETFKYVAPIAGTLGYSVEDTAVAVGLMANAGIKGSQAGTALRASLSRLANPTSGMNDAMSKLGISLTDSTGKMKPLSALMDDMRSGLSGMTQDQKAYYVSTIFGQEAMSGILAIVNASKQDYDSLTKSINNANGSAKQMAETMSGNLKGQLTRLGGAVQDIGIEIYSILAPSFQKAVDFAQSLADKFSKLDDATKKTIVKTALFAMALGPVIAKFGIFTGTLSGAFAILAFIAKNNAFALLSKGFGKIGTGIGKIKTGFTVLKALGIKGIFTMIGGCILPIIFTIGLLVAAGYLLYKNWDMLKAKGLEFVNSLQSRFGGFVPTVQGLWENLKEIFIGLLPVFGGIIGGIIGGLGSFIGTLVGLVGSIIEIFKGITDFLIGVFTLDWQRAWNGIKEIFEGIVDAIKGIFQGVMDFFGSIINGFKQGVGIGQETADKARADNAKNTNWTGVKLGESAVAGAPYSAQYKQSQVQNYTDSLMKIGSNLPAHAKGVENFKGGLSLVGEEGPELVYLPKGSSVKNNKETLDIFANSKKFINFTAGTSTTTNSYDSSSVSTTTSKSSKVYNFSPTIQVTTTSNEPEKVAGLTKNEVKKLFDEFVDEQELVS